jgi:hypothetical protein
MNPVDVRNVGDTSIGDGNREPHVRAGIFWNPSVASRGCKYSHSLTQGKIMTLILREQPSAGTGVHELSASHNNNYNPNNKFPPDDTPDNEEINIQIFIFLIQPRKKIH